MTTNTTTANTPITIDGTTYRRLCVVPWGIDIPRETTEDEPARCTCCGEPMPRATGWPTCGACRDCPF